MDFDDMIMRAAIGKKMINNTLNTIPNLTGMMMHVADELFFEMAQASRGQHTYDPELVKRCCQYLFRKAVEAVKQWGDSADGHIVVHAGLAEVLSESLPPDTAPETLRALANADQFGTALFESHIVYVEAQADYSGELFMVEMCLLFRWCMSLGISFAIERKGFKRIPIGQTIESLIPTAETYAWMRNFVPRRN